LIVFGSVNNVWPSARPEPRIPQKSYKKGFSYSFQYYRADFPRVSAAYV